MQIDMYFQSLEKKFQNVERDYNWAVAENKPEQAELGEKFDQALIDFNAALDVEFDVKEAVNQEKLIPTVTLTEEEEEELTYPIKDARAKDGGQADITTLMKKLFDNVSNLE